MLLKLLLPHPHAKKRSVLLQHQTLLGYVFFILSLIFTSFLLTSGISNILGYATDIRVQDLLKLTNELRQENGLGALELNPQLSKAAKAKALHMFSNNYWAHTSPDGKEPWDFIIASGYDYQYAGENLAVDFAHSESVVKAWNKSPSHQRNLLNDKYRDIGFAVVDGELDGRKTTLVVQLFGYPRGVPARDLVEVATPTQDLVETVGELANVSESVALSTQKVGVEETVGAVLNSASVFNTSRSLAIILGLFLTATFAIDGIYVKRMGILRLTGHTLLHVIVLILVMVGIWYTNIGLVL